ncbi:MAG TPA: hypothetical protein PLM86_00090 [Bacteroidales bacterium]|nr:hypothetical protein [Bacteroidales bacterium]OQB71496.1 MAG: hypothetical protein BWX93_00021 [Bacteroidetes bacterium ADurb.Bin139]MDD4436283.1 hypothetical protein [Bacteroidales bacterium]HOG24577.1 hypothetical protein [Bacteroidales bacterium]HOR11272.1 hypothetical protein [Bacteroidales bacterium]
MKNNLRIILFWAVCWGLAEAVIGFLLHFVENSAGILLYPFGAYCLIMAFKKSERKVMVPVLVTLIAALFKLSNLAFTSPEFHYRVYFPVIAILSEGLITSGLLFITTLVPVQNLLIKPGIKK